MPARRKGLLRVDSEPSPIAGEGLSGPKPDLYAAAEDERELRTLPVIRLRRRDQHGSTHIASRRSASSTYAFPHKFDGFLTRFAVSKQ
jgi:hypothetical protein